MKNTSKLRTILELYIITLDIEDGSFYATAINKRTNNSKLFIHKSYTELIVKLYGHMRKELKDSLKINYNS